ncbi:MAG: PHP domain-containing protein, partial [Pseudomonadota bacterium]|nr:PHP domain-containing protein [Pseudomonadota bacterium]
MSPPPFIHLHLHSEFSVADGMVRIKPLVERLVELEMPSVALTDLANLYGAVKFYRACLARGIKPVLGADVWVQSPLDPSQTDRLVLLCRNNEGYRGLCRLLTAAYLQGQGQGQTHHPGRAVIPAENLAAESGSLIALVCAEHAIAARELVEGNDAAAEQLLRRYQQLFDDRLYLELARVGRPHEEIYIDHALELAARRSLPVVASNRVQFLHAANYDAHEIRVCINEGRVLEDSRRPRLFTDQQYLRSSKEMATLFEDIPEALANTREIARRCNTFLRFNRNYLPTYPDLGDQPV